MDSTVTVLSQAINRIAVPLTDPGRLDTLMDLIGNSRFVLLGEASHGTSEYYLWRAQITRRLIEEKGFSFIAVEGDWPDCYRINRFIKGYLSNSSVRDVLDEYKRWPAWMWANWEMASLIEWLKRTNDTRSQADKIGFYGLDVYSLWESMEVILQYLEENDPKAAETAKHAYLCFEPYNRDVQEYAWASAMVPKTCENEVVELLTQLRSKMPEYRDDSEARLNAELNGLVAVDAERYYRAMVRSDVSSWNIRDHHMAEVLDRLIEFHGPQSKVIVWEHNTHIGDARATDMADAGMVNVGQLVREQYSDAGVVLVGFGTYSGSVIAGDYWGAPAEPMEVPPARQGSWEDIMHRSGANDKLLILPYLLEEPISLEERGHRAIGVVYHPHREVYGNYVPTVLPNRYDAFLYLDETQALHPVHDETLDLTEPPETYPWGM